MDLAEVLKEYGHRHGADGLALDDEGLCELLLDGRHRLIVDHRPSDRAVFLRFPFELPDAPEAERAVLYRRLLEANLLGEATVSGAFSIDPEVGRLEFHRRLALGDHLTPRAFADAVDALYGVARHFAGEPGLRPPPEDDDEG